MFDFEYFLENCDEIVWDAIVVGEKLKDSKNYLQIVSYLDAAIWRDQRKNADIYFYGSRMYGLASDSSDLDIFVDDKNGKFIY